MKNQPVCKTGKDGTKTIVIYNEIDQYNNDVIVRISIEEAVKRQKAAAAT
jgi:hypothetical protein